MSIVVRNNRKLRAANKRLRDELADTQELLDMRMHETEHALQMLEEERAAKEEAQAELAKFKAKTRAEVEAEVKAELKAEGEAKVKAALDRIKANTEEKIRTERAKSAAMERMLKKAQRESKSYMTLKAAHKGMILFADSFFAPDMETSD